MDSWYFFHWLNHPHMIKNDPPWTKHKWSALLQEKSGKWNYIRKNCIVFLAFFGLIGNGSNDWVFTGQHASTSKGEPDLLPSWWTQKGWWRRIYWQELFFGRETNYIFYHLICIQIFTVAILMCRRKTRFKNDFHRYKIYRSTAS